MAVENDHLETLQMLLEERSVLWNLYRPDVNERVPLHYAAMVKDIRVGHGSYPRCGLSVLCPFILPN